MVFVVVLILVAVVVAVIVVASDLVLIASLTDSCSLIFVLVVEVIWRSFLLLLLPMSGMM